MLSKIYRLKLKSDFEKVFKFGRAISSDPFFLKFRANNLKNSRFGFIVSLKISKKSTVRNLIKRRLRAIIRSKLKIIKAGYDIVFIVKPVILKKKYFEIEKEIDALLNKAELINS